MKLKDDLKDWQIAKIMFGKNNQAECKIVKKLRKKKLTLAEDCGDGVYVVDVEGEEVGWIMFKEMLSLD